MSNSADPDQLASSEPTDLDLHCLQDRAYPGSAGQGLSKQQVSVIKTRHNYPMNKLSHTIYWKSPFSILGKSDYMM